MITKYGLLVFQIRKPKRLLLENDDGSYTIFIETSLSRKSQQEAFLHAMKHFLGNDFEKVDVNKIERQAHNAGFVTESNLN